MRQKSAFDRDALHFAPFLLFPSPFPQKEFDLGVELQPILNEVMHRVSHDHKFLQESLEKTIKVDQFTKRLWDIYETVRKEGFRQVRYKNQSHFLLHFYIFLSKNIVHLPW